ncbi:hypothetical protein HG531_008238 [Fusarium graminearum]|nr:hypothetical protein HG531_008238 [Fusarium graminearum]
MACISIPPGMPGIPPPPPPPSIFIKLPISGIPPAPPAPPILCSLFCMAANCCALLPPPMACCALCMFFMLPPIFLAMPAIIRCWVRRSSTSRTDVPEPRAIRVIRVVADCEDTFLDMLDGVFLVEVETLDVLHQPSHVAHAKQLLHELLRSKLFEIQHMFTSSDKHNGGVRGCNSRNGTTSVAGDFGGISLGEGTIVGNLGLGSVLLQLIKSTGSEGVGTDQTSLEASRLVVSRELCTGRCLSGTLETDKHDDIALALLWSERFGVGIDEFDEFIEDGFLDQALLVHGGGEFFEVDCRFDGLSQLADEFHVDVCFEESGADLLEHAIKGLDR